MFSQTSEYALRAVTFLADKTSPQTTQSIAEATRVPSAYLSKVLQALVRGGIVRSQRGAGGGISLAIEPDALTLLQVINVVDPIRRIRTCPLDLKSHGTRLCPLHARLDNAMAQIEAAFSATTLAELLAEPSDSVPLCDITPSR